MVQSHEHVAVDPTIEAWPSLLECRVYRICKSLPVVTFTRI